MNQGSQSRVLQRGRFTLCKNHFGRLDVGRKPGERGRCKELPHGGRESATRIEALEDLATGILRKSKRLIIIFNYCQCFLSLEQIIKQNKQTTNQPLRGCYVYRSY